MRYHAREGVTCLDLLIRDVPEDVVAAIDARAKRLGLSRSEYLRRQLLQVSGRRTTTLEDLQWFAETFSDLTDEELMAKAWRAG